MTSKKQKAADRAEAIETLRKILQPGDAVTTTVLHVSRSGMSRVIQCQAIDFGEPDHHPCIRDISWLVADAIGDRWDDRRGGVIVGGCGMDMCFATVYALGRALFPDGFAPSPMAKRPSDGKRVNTDVGRGRKRAAAVPFALDRAWVEKMAVKGFRFERGRNGDTSGWDTDGGYALRCR